MFGWFAPSCPVDPCAKAWIEKRFAWLVYQFGLEQWAHTPMILPHPHYFPDDYDQSREAAKTLFKRVCGYMKVDPDEIRLKFFADKAPPLVNANGDALPGAAGLYEWKVIRIHNDQLVHPMDLVGTMSHELSHARLLGEGRVNDGPPGSSNRG